jgi:hypothetical protein
MVDIRTTYLKARGSYLLMIFTTLESSKVEKLDVEVLNGRISKQSLNIATQEILIKIKGSKVTGN